VSDIGVDAAKTGMLASAELVAAVAAAVRDFGIGPLVVDPVLASSHLDPLLAGDALGRMRDELLPLAAVVTPNLPEASALVGFGVVDRDGMVEAGRALLGFGPEVVLVTGGHLDGGESPDLLLAAGAEPVWLEGARIPAASTHGTGCVLSAAIAAELARGMEPADACVAAKRFVEKAIAHAGPFGVDPGCTRLPST
jgi:hydroxymethylpyrimidine/phosphomethylpyrimidine kinase